VTVSKGASIKKVVIVTDPMCSWCWGMTNEFERARRELVRDVEFDFMLGGINTHGTQPIGDYGRRYLMKLWQDVHETTGQEFGFKLPLEYVHNSVLPCLAVEAVRDVNNESALKFLHHLQRRFFVDGDNINDLVLLGKAAESFGVDAEHLARCVDDPAYKERVKFQFDSATRFGTNALPSLLVEKQGSLKLLAGGFVDAEMLQYLLATQ